MADHDAPKTIVSVTPLSLDQDSRTWKQALSLADAGYRSVVIAAGVPIEIVSASRLQSSTTSVIAAPSMTTIRFETLRRRTFPWVIHAGFFAVWLGLYSLRSFFRPLRCMPRADLYVLHECSTYPAVALRAAHARAPIIYDAHDFYSRIDPDEQRPIFDRRFTAPFTRMLEARAMANAAAVTTVSDGLAHSLQHVYNRECIVVRNAHDRRRDNPAVDLKSRLGLARGTRLLVTVGNAKRGQALEQAMVALAMLPPDVHWAFLGGGYARLHDLSRQHNVESRVHLTGRLPPDVVVPTISGADVAVVLYHDYSENYRHALPNGFFQAIAAGLPQVVPRLPEIDVLVDRHGFAIKTDPTDPPQLAADILQLVENDGLRCELAAAARCAIRELDWSVEERKFLELVATIMQRRHELS